MPPTTRLSAKGQVVIPKDVRDAQGWLPGTEFEVVERPDGVLLRATAPARAQLSPAEVLARMQARIGYTGPRADESEWDAAIGRMFVEKDAEDRIREGR